MLLDGLPVRFSGCNAVRNKSSVLILLLLLPLILAGCKVELYSNVSEDDANTMMAVLLKNRVECDKIQAQEQSWTIRVDRSDISKALDILKAEGYPRQVFTSMGDVFKKEGLFSSPVEERIRYVYALSQDLSNTIARIDGVLAARVHIVLPENNPLSERTVPSAASVFVKYRPDCNVQAYILRIKDLVVNSIEGLTYDKVTVVLVEAQPDFARETEEVETRSILGVKVARDSTVNFLVLVGSLLLMFVIAMGAAAFFYRRTSQKSSGRAESRGAESEKSLVSQ
jgi:type III secretion protein J